MKPIRTVIIDDERCACERLKRLLTSFSKIQVIDSFTNSRQGFECVIKHKPDLIFLDVELENNVSAFDIIYQLNDNLKRPHIILVTAFPHYSIKAIKNEIFDYILKPVDIDGLAAGIGTLISLVYGFLFLYFGQMEYAIVSFSITGALVSFFLFNVFGTNNKIFMGDTGSLTLGVLFVVLTIWFNEIISTQGNHLEWTSPAISLAIMIVPVVDSLRIIYIRVLLGKSPFSPDKNHVHHQLIKINSNHLRASIIMVLANLLIICLSFGLIYILGNTVVFFLILAIGFSLASLPVLIRKFKRREMKSVHVHTYQEGIYLHLNKSLENLTVPKLSVNKQNMLTNEDLSKNSHSPWGKIHNS